MSLKTISLILTITYLITITIASEVTYSKARVESCPGCSLNRLKEVKAFVYEDLPKYDNVEFKKIQGAPPELVLFNEADEEVERLPLKALSRMDCNDLLLSKGFNLKPDAKLEL